MMPQPMYCNSTAPGASIADHLLPGARRNTARLRWIAGVLALVGIAYCALAAPTYPISQQQRETARQVAQAGVPLSELSPNAPERYTVKRGDTLWGIAALYLTSPWRWPELWGMNLQQIRNPHLIYPGQVLVLTRRGERALLQLADSELPIVKLSPRARVEPLGDSSIASLPPGAIEPFLRHVNIVDADAHQHAPRIVAGVEGRMLFARGDRAYARGLLGATEALTEDTLPASHNRARLLAIYRQAQPLHDPQTGKLLGYEAQAVGQATLVRGEHVTEDADGRPVIVPAVLDIVNAREEVRIGDRLLPLSGDELRPFVPHAPTEPVQGQIIKVYGDAVHYAGQNQVVVLNRGHSDGLEPGHVLAVLKDRARLTDTSDDARPVLLLPSERNGLMMVFRVFERVSYALVLQITDGVKIGDFFANP